MTFTSAADIKVRAKRWLWAAPAGIRSGLIALGTLALIAGREDIGKSTLAYTLIAQITKGELRGHYYGTPKDAAVAATEDSWESVIVPRLIAAGADLRRVYRIDVHTSDGQETALSLPSDIPQLEALLDAKDVAVILLDPLLSRLSGKIDTHKQAEVQGGLEPILKLADKVKATVLGLIHVNKGSSTHVLDQVMASKGFTTSARQVIFVEVDDEDPELRVVDLPKNNDGRKDFPHPTFRIESAPDVLDDENEIVTAARLVWDKETNKTAHDIQANKANAETGGGGTVTAAATWLAKYLADHSVIHKPPAAPADGRAAVESQQVKDAADDAGISAYALRNARRPPRVNVQISRSATHSYWRLPGADE